MFRLCFLLLVFHNTGFVHSETDSPGVLNLTKWSGTASNTPVITLNGQQNYNAIQQIFYFYGQRRSPLEKVTDRQVPDGYIVTPDVAAHKLNPRLLNWNRARKACIEEGGHLAVIRSEAEEKLMLKLLEESGKAAAWVGFHDQFEEGDWVSVKDEALENTGYSRWTTKFSSSQPDNNAGNQHCASLVKEGGMDDETCTVLRPYFCKIDLQAS
ncbi:hypothetical protein KM043_009441 [Ampulex compressa]|nr:hypothetical protein KM043_009441 [Ampulex compressa]